MTYDEWRKTTDPRDRWDQWRTNMSKVTPIGGVHKSASSLLAEIMNDLDVEKCVVVTEALGE